MPLMLHMTDLHLSAKAVNDVYDDYKIEILPPAERVTKRGQGPDSDGDPSAKCISDRSE